MKQRHFARPSKVGGGSERRGAAASALPSPRRLPLCACVRVRVRACVCARGDSAVFISVDMCTAHG